MTTDLRDQIAWTLHKVDPIGGHNPRWDRLGDTDRDWYRAKADAVMTLIAPLIAREKAEALRCAAWDWSDWDALESPEAWLRARADQIEQEADQ